MTPSTVLPDDVNIFMVTSPLSDAVVYRPDCMVKMMKALVRIQVASSQVMGPLTMMSPPPFFTVTLLPLAGIFPLLDQQQTRQRSDLHLVPAPFSTRQARSPTF